VTMRLSALVVTSGRCNSLELCLSRLERALAAVDGETELVTVQADGRLGFAGGVTAGLEEACGEWIALVNDDCLVEESALAELIAAAGEDPHVGSVAAMVRFADRPDTINSAGIEIDELGVARERGLGQAASGADEPGEVFGASATLALYRRAMLDAIGGFDASFFAYLEDADLAWRARMAGWRCVLAPRAVALHEHSQTLGHGSSAKHFLVGRNRVRMLAKNATVAQLRRRLASIVLYDAAYVAYVAVNDRTLAPLRGRIAGLREWSAYRDAGRRARAELALPPAPGLLAALDRNRVYRSLRPEPGR
jgi:GT2 family glycosyltransferase